MHEYLKVLREKAGHVPILVCGASVIIVNGRGEILLHRRRDNGCWAFPGGAADVDERVEDAARREILEETGLTVRSMRLFGVYSGPDMHHVYPNGDEISNVDVLFVSDDFAGALTPDHLESDEARFFPPDGLPAPISPPCVREVRDFLSARA
jgi:8-oxo-dGTP pyrophosphatase MutT (NUDIX family)